MEGVEPPGCFSVIVKTVSLPFLGYSTKVTPSGLVSIWSRSLRQEKSVLSVTASQTASNGEEKRAVSWDVLSFFI